MCRYPASASRGRRRTIMAPSAALVLVAAHEKQQQTTGEARASDGPWEPGNSCEQLQIANAPKQDLFTRVSAQDLIRVHLAVDRDPPRVPISSVCVARAPSYYHGFVVGLGPVVAGTGKATADNGRETRASAGPGAGGRIVRKKSRAKWWRCGNNGVATPPLSAILAPSLNDRRIS